MGGKWHKRHCVRQRDYKSWHDCSEIACVCVCVCVCWLHQTSKSFCASDQRPETKESAKHSSSIQKLEERKALLPDGPLETGPAFRGKNFKMCYSPQTDVLKHRTTETTSYIEVQTPENSKCESHMSPVRMWWGHVRPARPSSHASSSGLVSWSCRTRSLPFPLSLIEMMSALLWIPWQRQPQHRGAAGHGCVSLGPVIIWPAAFRAAVISWERWEHWENWIQRSSRCQNPVLKLHGDFCFLWFPPTRPPPGRGCVCMSHRPQPACASKKSDFNVVMKIMSLIKESGRCSLLGGGRRGFHVSVRTRQFLTFNTNQPEASWWTSLLSSIKHN